jgi:hypothetical protein
MKRTIEMLRGMVESEAPRRPVVEELRGLAEGFAGSEIDTVAQELKRVSDALSGGLREISDEDPDKKLVQQMVKSLRTPVQQVLKEASRPQPDKATLKQLVDAALAVCRPIPESLDGKVSPDVAETVKQAVEELMKPLVQMAALADGRQPTG